MPLICKTKSERKGLQVTTWYQWAKGSDKYVTDMEMIAMAKELGVEVAKSAMRQRLYTGSWPKDAVRFGVEKKAPEVLKKCRRHGCTKMVSKLEFCSVSCASRQMHADKKKAGIKINRNSKGRKKDTTTNKVDRLTHCNRKNRDGYLVICTKYGNWGKFSTDYNCACSGYEPSASLTD